MPVIRICVFLALSLSPSIALADSALIAVATNFANVAKKLEAEFEATTQHRITLVTGSTGKLYAQIINGAPFDALLAADQARPQLLEESGLAVAGTRFTFAVGRLALSSLDASLLAADVPSSIGLAKDKKFAIANPSLAPYGLASRETLDSTQQMQTVQDNIVMGENVGQAYALIATGNADIGFVALSMLVNSGAASKLEYIEVPAALHKPILQDAILLVHGESNVAAIAYLEYVKGDAARSILVSNGYGKAE